MEKRINPFVLILVGLVLGIGLTLWGQSLLSAKGEVKEAKQAVTGTAQAVVNANKEEVKLATSLENIAQNGGKIRDALDDRLNTPFELKSAANANTKTVPKSAGNGAASVNAVECPLATIDGNSYMPFDVGAVRLLNAARAGTPIDSVTVSDAESKAPAFITIRVFVRNDTEIAKMYNELAERHNSLVDQVAAYQHRQRLRLGIKE